MNILILNGPNLNLLGTREPEKYGKETLQQITEQLDRLAQTLNVNVEHFQSNHEGELIDKLHKSQHGIDFVIINPAAYTHTSIALRDAFLATQLPFIEIHLSNIYQREVFRQKSLLSDIAEGVICGFGSLGYQMALSAAHKKQTN